MSTKIPPRFVLLEHTGTPTYKPGVHWDLLCEDGDHLRAWEFPQPLTKLPQQAIALPAHRLMYLDYEGPISGDRGSVRRIAAGVYDLLIDSPRVWSICLKSETLRGKLRLSCPSPDLLVWEACFTSSS